MSDPILETRSLSIRRGGRQVLSQVSLGVRRGEVLGLIGPNGAGKTTLLRALCGLQPVDSGRVLYDGVALDEIERRERARRIAYLEQNGSCAWPLAVQDVVALGRLPYRAWPARWLPTDHDAVMRAMAETDSLEYAGRTLDTLSAGERARVLLARALAVEPAVLLADEPAAALDPAHQLGVMALLRQQAEAGLAVLTVLHDLSLAARFCHRLALLHQGQLIAVGTPVEVLTAENLSRGFAIEALSGTRDGEPFFLPWRRTEP